MNWRVLTDLLGWWLLPDLEFDTIEKRAHWAGMPKAYGPRPEPGQRIYRLVVKTPSLSDWRRKYDGAA